MINCVSSKKERTASLKCVILYELHKSLDTKMRSLKSKRNHIAKIPIFHFDF